MKKETDQVLDSQGAALETGDHVDLHRSGSNGRRYDLRCTVTDFIPAKGWLLISLRGTSALRNPWSARADETDSGTYQCPYLTKALQHTQSLAEPGGDDAH